MARVSFPQEASQMAAIQSRIPTASLKEVRGAVEELALLASKAKLTAQTVFESGLIEAALDRADALNDREIDLNHQICDLGKELGDLEIIMNRLAPLEIAEKLDELQRGILSCGRPSTQALQTQLQNLENKWNHLHFLYAFPDTEELNADSFQSNLINRILDRIERVQKSDPEQAARLGQSLASLQQQCKIAEELFFAPSLSTYRKLPREICLEVEQRLFERFPTFSLEQIDQGEGGEKLVGAIMASLSDRMMKIEM